MARKRQDGRYAVSIRHTDPATGQRHRTYFYGKSLTEARRKAEDGRRRLASGSPVRDASRTLGEWLTEWTETFLAASNRARSTKVMHAAYCRVWITPRSDTSDSIGSRPRT